MAESDAVNHPDHYGGSADPYEAIKVIEAWGLGFCLGNAAKYICRAGKKPGQSRLQDLKKARWYLDRAIRQFGPDNDPLQALPVDAVTDAVDVVALTDFGVFLHHAGLLKNSPTEVHPIDLVALYIAHKSAGADEEGAADS